MSNVYKGLKAHEAKGSGYTIVGKTECGCYVRAKQQGDTGSPLIYQPVYAEMNADEHDWITCVGFWEPKKIRPLSKADREFLDQAYSVETHSCAACGMYHDADAYVDVPYTIRDCEVYCLECVPDELRLEEVKEPKDVFKAPRIDTASLPDCYEEVETLFCDSSGWGNEREPALTVTATEQAVKDLLEQHGTLYAGLTGVGQFQVYVTLYRKVETKKKSKAK
jgi:hypothetical protein